MSGQITEGGIVIIGGGQAGGWAARTLRDKGYDGILTVISDEPYDFYERPPLSKQVLRLPEDAAPLSRLFSEQVVEKMDINWRRPIHAECLLPEQRVVCLPDGERIRYQKLLIATGSKARVPCSDWLDHPQVLTLRTWDDARQLRQRLQQCDRLVIIGGGWIGLEIAATARQSGKQVTVLERQPALCMRSVNAAVSEALLTLHQQQGVEVYCDCGDIRLMAGEAGNVIVSTAHAGTNAWPLVVVGTGVELNLRLARQAGLKIENGIVVDHCGRTSQSDIFAAGDVAQHHQLGISLQSWAYAQNQAVVTARAMLDPLAEGYDEPAWLWSDQYEHNIQIVGIPAPDSRLIRRVSDTGQLFISLNEQNQLQQLVAFNDGRTAKLAKRWIATGRILPPDQLADPGFSLMTLRQGY